MVNKVYDEMVLNIVTNIIISLKPGFVDECVRNCLEVFEQVFYFKDVYEKVGFFHPHYI